LLLLNVTVMASKSSGGSQIFGKLVHPCLQHYTHTHTYMYMYCLCVDQNFCAALLHRKALAECATHLPILSNVLFYTHQVKIN
jgi:hypothetical protein